LPYIGIAMIGIVVVLALLSGFMANRALVMARQVKFDEVTTELQRVRESAEKVKELEAKQASIAAKDKAIKEITSDRIVWSEELCYLARLMPNDVWLKDVQVETKTRTKTVPNPNAKEGEPKTKKIVVPYQSLKLCGYALSEREEVGVNRVGIFVRAIEDDEQFSTYFKYPEPRLVKDEEFGGVKVKEFEVNCQIVTGKEAQEN